MVSALAPEGSDFAEVLAWHIERGTRPKTEYDPHWKWTLDALAVAAGYESHGAVSNHLARKNKPKSCKGYLRAFFGADPALREASDQMVRAWQEASDGRGGPGRTRVRRQASATPQRADAEGATLLRSDEAKQASTDPGEGRMAPKPGRGFASSEGDRPQGTSPETVDPGLVWMEGRYLPAILDVLAFRIRLPTNHPLSSAPCPVHAVLILPGEARDDEKLRVLIGFEELRLFFENGGHHLPTESMLGVGDNTPPPGVTFVTDYWRLTSPDGGSGIIPKDPLQGTCLFRLEGRGVDAKPAKLDLFVKAEKIKIIDAATMEPLEDGKRRSILERVFAKHNHLDPDGKGEYRVGGGEIWQERQR